jgi:hypothetical protein
MKAGIMPRIILPEASARRFYMRPARRTKKVAVSDWR